MSLASFPGQCPGNEATMLAECHRSHDYVFHKIVFSLPVWTQVLTLTISRMMSCGWILSTPMAKGSVQCQSVVKCVVPSDVKTWIWWLKLSAMYILPELSNATSQG